MIKKTIIIVVLSSIMQNQVESTHFTSIHGLHHLPIALLLLHVHSQSSSLFSKMSFPPITITSPFIIDTTSRSPLLFQEFSSLLPPLDQICSPFSRGRLNGYSRIKDSAAMRSKSVDFADLSYQHQSPGLFPLETKTNLTTKGISIPEEGADNGSHKAAAFRIILSQTCSIYSPHNATAEQERLLSFQNVVNESLSVKRASSVSERYSIIPQHSDLPPQHDSKCKTKTTNKYVKKKAKLIAACRRFLGL